MSCKHRTVEGRTTKYFYCKILNKSVDDYKCRDCMMKIENENDAMDYLNKIFGGFKNK